MRSCLYEGVVRHRRFAPVGHEFSYRLYLSYIDLAELDELDRLWPLAGARFPALAWLRRADYFGEGPLAEAVRDLVARELGRRPTGAIRLCTHLRQLGTFMNPVSFFYCYEDGAEGALDAIVAEVSNTPWDERHPYVLDARRGLHFRFPKAFHVSPFLGMGMIYDWRFTTPGERLVVHMECEERGAKLLDATLTLDRVPLERRTLAAALVRFPAMSARVLGAIYWQALRLWWKGAPFFSHPATTGER